MNIVSLVMFALLALALCYGMTLFGKHAIIIKNRESKHNLSRYAMLWVSYNIALAVLLAGLGPVAKDNYETQCRIVIGEIQAFMEDVHKLHGSYTKYSHNENWAPVPGTDAITYCKINKNAMNIRSGSYEFIEITQDSYSINVYYPEDDNLYAVANEEYVRIVGGTFGPFALEHVVVIAIAGLFNFIMTVVIVYKQTHKVVMVN